MKLTELMFDVQTKNIYDWIRVEGRAISGDPFDSQSSIIQMLFEAFEKVPYVITGRVVVQDLIDKSIKGMVVHNRQHTERTIIQFVSGNIAGKTGKHRIEIIVFNSLFSFFSPWPPPSS